MIVFLVCFVVGCYLIASMVIALDAERIIAIIFILWILISAIRELFK